MSRIVTYHPDAVKDLERLGHAQAKNIVKAIEEKLVHGEPDKFGKPLRGDLSHCRSLRVGANRVVYKLSGNTMEILIIAASKRDNDEVYTVSTTRVFKAERSI